MKSELKSQVIEDNEIDNRIQRYEATMEKLKKALNTNGWDGRWFKRAFMDDGSTLR